MNEIKNKEELKKSLEDLRSAKYQDVPAELLSKILDVLSISGDTTKAMESINVILKEYLK